MVANPRLLKSQGVEHHKEAIDTLHDTRDQLYELMHEENDVAKLRYYDEQCTQLEFKLQELWGFEKNPDFHKFWNRPKCTCPKMDNDDRYPLGSYYISSDCPLHGTGTELE